MTDTHHHLLFPEKHVTEFRTHIVSKNTFRYHDTGKLGVLGRKSVA